MNGLQPACAACGGYGGQAQQKFNRSYPDSYRDRYHKKALVKKKQLNKHNRDGGSKT